VKTPKEFLEKALSTKFNPDKAKGFEAVAQVNITGTDGGNWIITTKKPENRNKRWSRRLARHHAQNEGHGVDLVNGKLNAVNAFMTGKLEFNGSMAIGLKLLDMGFM